MQEKTATIIGGYPLTQYERSVVFNEEASYKFFIAVDGGLEAFFQARVLPDVLIGDMDSCSKEAFTWYSRLSSRIIFFKKDKDFLDMQAALDLLYALKIKGAFIFGALGGRIDQTFSCLPFLIRGLNLDLELKIISNEYEMGLFSGPGEFNLKAQKGTLWSFIALDTCVQGVTLKGFRFPLENENISNSQTRALSNSSNESEVLIRIRKGTLIYFNKPGRHDHVEY